MSTGRIIRRLGIAVFIVILGALGSWWFWQAVEREPDNVQAMITTLEADIQDTQKANERLRMENEYLKQDNSALQTNLTEISQRVAALEHTDKAPETDVQHTDVLQLKGRVVALENTNMAMKSGIRDTERTNAHLQSENQQLKQDSTSLQKHVVELSRRVTSLEATKTALESTIESMRNQLDQSVSKRANKRVAPEKSRPIKRNIAPNNNRKKTTDASNTIRASTQRASTLQSLAQDELALLLIRFLRTHETDESNWFNPQHIQSLGGEQVEFDLFQYHAWTTIEAKLRSMERLRLVRGRDDVDSGGRQFAIRHGGPLTRFQTLAQDAR